MSVQRRAAVAALTAALTFGLTGCFSTEEHHAMSPASPSPAAPSAGSSAEDHNTVDVTFAQGMIPHHRQAVTMADLAETRAGAKVRALAARIKAAQAPEIATMTGWLTAWGAPVPAEDAPMDHGAHAGHAMPGMLSDADMSSLEAASGPEFDTLFLRLMIVHHEGAVEMARSERAGGAYGPAKDLAGQIITAQQAEIKEMKALLPS
ncbi:DUF305 domain-containing protein [Actinocorallia sp. API 0066]|uniref:DUF305 domain-containing protein n=1 Tax=Actinocorallia sp. API 0066 TaxID=2896846 RepID=UPI001E5388CE|nr:DUF305 domain-containing protein [Actinocorallia sp. API 0066]MCD0449794.1 DUF305 domain-containing protein [Actinocorallia sp. API 0066]